MSKEKDQIYRCNSCKDEWTEVNEPLCCSSCGAKSVELVSYKSKSEMRRVEYMKKCEKKTDYEKARDQEEYCRKLSQRYSDSQFMHQRSDYTSYMVGFMAAQTPEALKLNPHVIKLVEALRKIRDGEVEMREREYYEPLAAKALEDFKGD